LSALETASIKTQLIFIFSVEKKRCWSEKELTKKSMLYDLLKVNAPALIAGSKHSKDGKL